jgi:hypothetical protein
LITKEKIKRKSQRLPPIKSLPLKRLKTGENSRLPRVRATGSGGKSKDKVKKGIHCKRLKTRDFVHPPDLPEGRGKIKRNIKYNI